jgi:stage II sporulation protein D
VKSSKYSSRSCCSGLSCFRFSAFCLAFSLFTFPFSLDPALAGQAPSNAAWFVRDLTNPRDRREANPRVLDTPTLPGSVVKAVTLVTALEAGAITPQTATMCRRTVTVDGVRYTCAHPDLKRPLSPAEALAHSCNDFFVSLAPRLSRSQVNQTRLAAGLPPLPGSVRLPAALVGLDGPRVSPRSLIDVMARLTGVGSDPPVAMRPATRAVLLEGLAGAAAYGTASGFQERGVTALAKTGTAPMPGGGVAGVVVALVPAARPTRGLVVVAPGGAGLDAATIAAGLVSDGAPATTAGSVPAPAASSPPAAQPRAAADDRIRLGHLSAGGRPRIETLAMDDYIAQVLAGEGQPTAGDAAQQALAIAARTFAQANRNRHRREGFDLCDTTHCQVVRRATPATQRAAAMTSGRILLQGNQPAQVFYSASCGGRLERASQVWPGAVDLSQPERDDADEDEPAWFSEMRVGDIERALRAAGLRGGRLRDLRVVQRNGSGRAVRLRVDGFSPPEISATDFRMAIGRIVGWQFVKSTAFDVDRTGTGYRFRGRGHGHGVGLCVVGAGVRARRGDSAEAILGFYFPTLTIGRTGVAPRRADAAVAPTPQSAPAPSSTPRAEPVDNGPTAAPPAPASLPRDVQIALPGAEEGERAALLSLVRRARDETAAETGQKPPASLRITVHPTVESFGRATGQPWWVSGATSGGAIELLSITLLQQRGQLERTVRHEVVHALLDPALASRPMWVREGAAIYFSQPSGSRRKEEGRVRCPSDEELLRPVSAGAQREAYARAEACFARQIDAGRKWTDVR